MGHAQRSRISDSVAAGHAWACSAIKGILCICVPFKGTQSPKIRVPPPHVYLPICCSAPSSTSRAVARRVAATRPVSTASLRSAQDPRGTAWPVSLRVRSQSLPSATGLKLPRGCGVREGAGSDEGLGSSQPGLRLPALGMALGGLTPLGMALGGVVDRGRTPSYATAAAPPAIGGDRFAPLRGFEPVPGEGLLGPPCDGVIALNRMRSVEAPLGIGVSSTVPGARSVAAPPPPSPTGSRIFFARWRGNIAAFSCGLSMSGLGATGLGGL